MQAQKMFDTSTAGQSLAPGKTAKPAEPARQSFSKVLKEQGPAEKPVPREKPPSAEKPTAQQQPAARSAAAEQKGATTESAHSAETKQVAGELQAEAVTEAAAQQPQTDSVKPVAQLVTELLRVLEPGETPDTSESSGSIEELLGQLVQQLESGELKGELKGEQVQAGVDLSALVEQLQQLGGQEDGPAALQQLVAEIATELTDQAGLQQAALLPNPGQSGSGHTPETLAQARQLLQRVIDQVQGSQTESPESLETVATGEEDAAATELLQADRPKEPVDQRFAGLLKPRSEQQVEPLRQRLQAAPQGGNSQAQPVGQEVAPQQAAVNPEQASGGKFAELLNSTPQQGVEELLPQNPAQGVAQGHNLNPVTGRVIQPPTPMVQLPSGQAVPESQIFDQVVTKMSGSFNGESGRMVLRMQPAELGSLKLELTVEGDRIRANLQAQTYQVQEVLERNLPQLRSALAEQGLKIDQFQVDVEQQNHQEQFDNLAQQHQQGHQRGARQPAWQQNWQPEEQIVPLAHLLDNGGGGISLHV